MIEIVQIICMFVLVIFMCFSGIAFAGYMFEKEKQKGMIIFTLIMFITSIALVIVYMLITSNIPPVVGTIIAR